ncbi:endonuclease domain-containing 1 protein-like [Anomaloglossus baeobatrachus]|uniref:endonuclease domain-containing 1 protein-like n=1 Tax=Anomaloglossus baeobatrachus TaxID=238106 RepID=UPI003F4F74F6
MKPLLSISLILAVAIGTYAEVLDSFNACLNYFYKGHIPSGFQGITKSSLFDPNNLPDGIKKLGVDSVVSPAYICQRYLNAYRYATLYDRGRRMPLYSAYIMNLHADLSKTCPRCKAFKVEAQLPYRNVESKEMTLYQDAKEALGKYNKKNNIEQRESKNRPPELLQTSQAVDEDYTNTEYQRGHLNPCGHQTACENSYNATFTLTNVVPMVPEVNNNIWSPYEKEMMKILADREDVIYIITGIVPGNVPIKKDGLSAPTHVWNAYCHVSKEGIPRKSGAALVENTKVSKIETFDDVVAFQTKMKNILGTIQLFQKDCKP